MKSLLIAVFLVSNIYCFSNYIVWDTSYVIEENTFRIVAHASDSTNYFHVIKDKKDTTTYYGFYFDIYTTNFNNDSFPDIHTSIHGTLSNELLLYDPVKKEYVPVANMTEFNEAKAIKASDNLYYSHRRAGCADQNWTSSLFTIKNYEPIQIGYFYANGCGDFDEKISFYQIIKIW